MFPKSFGLVLVTLKLTISFGSTGVTSWLPSFKLMETVLSLKGIAVPPFVRKIDFWLCFVFFGNYI